MENSNYRQKLIILYTRHTNRSYIDIVQRLSFILRIISILDSPKIVKPSLIYQLSILQFYFYSLLKIETVNLCFSTILNYLSV